MEVAAPTTRFTNILNGLSTSVTHKLTHPNTFFTHCPYTKPNMFVVYTCPKPFFAILSNLQRARNTILTSTCCSTKPNIDSDNAMCQNSTVQPSSNSKPQRQSTRSSNETFSSSSSSSSGLVFDLGPVGSWDSAEIGSPVVKRFIGDEEERWYMWYHGRSDGNSGSDSIGLAVSSNGVHWERGTGYVRSNADAGLVMNCSRDWWAFDTESIRPSEVMVMSSTKVRASSAVYWLYYTGCNASEKVKFAGTSLQFPLENPEMVCIGDEKGEKGEICEVFKSLPGLAISQDGRHWARIEGEHHTGALFDVGSEREWDSTFIASPQVVFHGSGDLRMYYHSFDEKNGLFAIGIARSRDGIKWLKLGKILGGAGLSGCFDEFGVMNACVLRNRKDGKYVMAYEGVAANGGRSIGLAGSPDGLKDWRRLQDKAILKPSADEGWDSIGVGSPCLVQMDGNADEWRLYYRGIGNGGKTGIGMAVSQGSERTSFRRWTGFHL